MELKKCLILSDARVLFDHCVALYEIKGHVNWTELTRERIKWRTFANTLKKLQVT